MHNIHSLLIQVRVYPFALFPFSRWVQQRSPQRGLRMHSSRGNTK